jgi:hypothetical protein
MSRWCPVSEHTGGMPDSQAAALRSEFRKALEGLLNAHSQEGWSSTPDFILAQFLTGSLRAFDAAVSRRDEWYLNGQHMEPAQTPAERARWLRQIDAQTR